MAQIALQQAGGVNVVAFLDMLAWSEGTDNGKQATKDRGYDVIVGGQLFKSYAAHPRVLVDLPKLKIQSTAAGRYQLLHRYYDAYKKTLGLKDFSPLSQDLIALQQIRENRALPLIQAGKIPKAIKAVSNIWAIRGHRQLNPGARELRRAGIEAERFRQAATVQPIGCQFASPGDLLKGVASSLLQAELMAPCLLLANEINEQMGRQLAGGRLPIGFLQEGPAAVKDRALI